LLRAAPGMEWLVWIAESILSGRTVMLGAAGTDRRSAMLGLARKFEANRF
jgi:hypothetical protein